MTPSKKRRPFKILETLGALLVGLYLGLAIGCGGSSNAPVADEPENKSAETDIAGDDDAKADAADDAANEETVAKTKPSVKVVTSTSKSKEETAPEFPESLAIGDKAPQIYLGDFYAGDAIDKMESGKIYVIEFWATWCPPCRTSMPHLSSLQEKYGDKVTVLGITKEGQKEVGPFLAEEAKGQGGKLWVDVVKYRLAQDKNQWTNLSYMKPSGQGGIPSAFIVGSDGYIEWIGHPMGMDDALEQVVAGTWDRVAGAKLIASIDAFQAAAQAEDWDKAVAAIEGIDDPSVNNLRFQGYASMEKFDEAHKIAAGALEGKPNPDVLNEYAWIIATAFPKESKDLDLALKLAETANQLTDENAPPVLDTLARVYFERGEFEAAVKCQEKAVLYGDDASYEATLKKYVDENDKPVIPESLTIGDPAPKFFAAQWFTGEELSNEFEDGKVYVIEFWATWCPPCRDSMPHLSKLQEEYKDKVVFIGFTREEAGKVDAFMAKEAPGQDGQTWDEVVKYRLAQDRHDWTSESYMKAAKQGGIPSAFVVGKDGHIEWIGHPMQIDKPLEEILNDKWDREAAVVEAERKAKLQAVMAAARPRIMKAQRGGDMDDVLAVFEDMEAELGEDANLLAGSKFSLLVQVKKYEEAIETAKAISEGSPDDGRLLNMVAWAMATSIPEEDRDLDLALKLAQQATAATDESDPTVIDTLARVYFEQKDFDKAIETQERAMELGGARYEEALDEYKAAKEDANKPAEADENEEDNEEDKEEEDKEEDIDDAGDSDGAADVIEDV